MIVPDDIDRNVGEKLPQGLRTPLIAMTCTVVGQGRRQKISAWFVRRRRAHMVGVDRIADEQEEIELLGTHHIEDRVSGSATSTMLLATQIAAPGKGHRHPAL